MPPPLRCLQTIHRQQHQHQRCTPKSKHRSTSKCQPDYNPLLQAQRLQQQQHHHHHPPPPPKPQATPSATATATGSVIPPQGAAQQTHGSMAYYNPQTQGSASYSTPGNPSSSPGTGYSINQMGPNRQLQSTATCSGSGQVVGNKSPEDEDSLQLLKFGDFSSNTKYKDASGNIYVKLKSEDYSKPEIFKTLTGQTPKSSVNINECTAKRSLVYPREKDECPSPSASTGTLSSGTPPIDPIPTKSASKSPSGKPLQAPLSTEHTTDG